MNEAEQTRLHAANQLIQLIETVASLGAVHEETTSALNVVDAIADYIKLKHSQASLPIPPAS